MLYQLLRTTPYLSGQVMNNLIISKTLDGITIDKLDITPLTDKISFNDSDKREYLNYTHEENIKHIYREIRDDFFTCTQNFIGEKFIYSQDYIDTHDHTYLSGLRRMCYSQYNKQFSFLVPLWISENIDFNELKFNILVQKQGTKFYNIRTSVGLSKDIAEYYNNFFNDINDDLINLRLDTNEAFLSGINVETGLSVVKNVSYLVENILSIERPLLEFDYLFSSLFKENKVVSKQLINFNLVFNLMDLTVSEVVNYGSMFAGKPLNIIVEVLYKGELLTKKDLYTNYEYIPITITDGITTNFHADTSQDYNVLKYLGDNKMTDFIYTNKLTQPIHHWALLENPDALYNLYDGFAPYLQSDDGEFYRIQGHFQNQGDLSLREYNIYDNNLSWCKYFKYNNMLKSEIQYNLITKDEIYTEVTIDTSKQTTWINGNKFEINYINENTGDYLFNTGEKFRFKIIECSNQGIYKNNNLDDVPSESYKSFKYKTPTGEENNVALISLMNDQKVTDLIFFSNNKNGLTLETIRNSVLIERDDLSEEFKNTFDKFKRMLNGYIKPYKIVFNKTVRTVTDGDELKTNYVYNNDKNVYSYVYRYFGKVIPFFINPDNEHLKNFDYYYEQWNDINEQYIKKYNRLLSEGYTPIYPDVKLDDEHYFYSLRKDEFYNKWNWEFTDGLENRVFNLPEEIHLQIEVVDYINKTQLQINDEVYLEFEKYFKTYLRSYFDSKRMDESQKIQFIRQFITPLYDKESEFDYVSDTNVKSLLFDIKYSLK